MLISNALQAILYGTSLEIVAHNRVTAPLMISDNCLSLD